MAAVHLLALVANRRNRLVQYDDVHLTIAEYSCALPLYAPWICGNVR